MRLTVRVKLTALCGGMVVGGGMLLASAIYLLVSANLVPQLTGRLAGRAHQMTPATPLSALPTMASNPQTTITVQVARTSSDTMLTKLMLVSSVSLLVLAVLATAVSWWISGRVLRPVKRISTTARELSSDNLHQRIALCGPRDELTELADTFDGMLDRLESAFDSQRRFIANASHELRTPLAIQRAAVQIGLAGERSETVTRVSEQLLAANRRSERLIDGLLTLARSDRGVEHREPVALHTVVAEQLELHATQARDRRIEVTHELRECWVLGDPVLITQLVANLIANAVRHNLDGGRIQVNTDPSLGLSVLNTGPELDASQVPELFEPFRRGVNRTSCDEGTGLGLSIVRSIVRAHGGAVQASARDGGGLNVHVELPKAEGTQRGNGRNHGSDTGTNRVRQPACATKPPSTSLRSTEWFNSL
jgi:signal transduction histidine kinase